MKYLFTFSLSVISLFSFAQQTDAQDSTNATVTPSTYVDPMDTIPKATIDPAATDDEGARIIYYQDAKVDHKQRQDDIRTISGSMHHHGGFFGLSIRSSNFQDEALVLGGIRTGWIVNRTLGIGFEGHGVIPTSDFSNIVETEDVKLIGGYGGMFLEWILFSNQVVHVTFPVAGGAGWLGFVSDWENKNSQDELYYSDIFWYVEPGASVELNVSRSFRLGLGMSKRFAQDFDLTGATSDDFDNLNFFLTIKVGRF